MYMCTCTAVFVKIDWKVTNLSVFILASMGELVVLVLWVQLLLPIPELLSHLENVGCGSIDMFQLTHCGLTISDVVTEACVLADKEKLALPLDAGLDQEVENEEEMYANLLAAAPEAGHSTG